MRNQRTHSAWFLVPVLFFVIIAQTGCSRTQEPVAKQSFHFDTVCTVTVFAMENMSQENASEAIEETFRLLREYENLFSRTKEGTDVWKINHAQGRAVTCDPRTVDLIKKSLLYSELSGGLFSVTAGAASGLWDFHEGQESLPDPEALAEAVRHIDDSAVLIDGNTVTLKDPAAVIDLGAIAKGYAADGADRLLRDRGVTSAVINLGGNISCIGGKPPKTDPFVIGIELPYSDMRKIVGTTGLTDSTIATSGVYERFFDMDGKRYHHILNVSDGYPAETDILGVSVTSSAGRSADCDALSTICLILGRDEAMSLIEGMEGYEALVIASDGSVSSTSGFSFTEQK